jgi:polyferredoxin/formate hydrogenlyase subunit 6/NADH:ubiquinone oxidoreductase subunit I
MLLALFAGSVVSTTWRSEGLLVDLFLLMDPLLSGCAAVAGRVWLPALLGGLLLLLATAVLGRFFCGWVCPLGTILDLWELAVARRRRPERPRPGLRMLRYGLLALLLVAALWGSNLAWGLDPITWAKRLFTFVLWPAGAGLVSLLLAISRPLLEALGWYDLAWAVVDVPAFGGTGLVTLLFVGGLLGLSLLERRFWCRYLCPLGGLLALASWRPLFGRAVAAGCDASGACARACPTGAIGARHRRYDPMECVVCGDCLPACAPAVSRFGWLGGGRSLARVDHRRRWTLLGIGGGLALAWLPRPVRAAWVRPPGALPEEMFESTCVRCGQCTRACPTRCLQPVLLTGSLSSLMSPVADMGQGHCDPACRACGLVCPTGAIRPLELTERQHAKMGSAVVDEHRCLAFEEDKLCLICQEHCPLGAIRGEEREGRLVPVVDREHCNGCGICEHRCPVQGPAGIQVDPAEEIRLARGSYQRAFLQRYGCELFRRAAHPDKHRKSER